MCDPRTSPDLKEVAVVGVMDEVLQHSRQVKMDDDWGLITHPVEGPGYVCACSVVWVAVCSDRGQQGGRYNSMSVNPLAPLQGQTSCLMTKVSLASHLTSMPEMNGV